MKDIYIKFGNPLNGNKIVGESRDKDHPKPWFEVGSWSHDIKQPKSATASTAGGPQLWESCSAGTLYDDVEIHFMRANGTQGRVQYLTIYLKKVIISRVTPVVEGEGLPSETFSLKYAAVKWEYIQQTMDGKTSKGTPAQWSLATNKPVFEAPN